VYIFLRPGLASCRCRPLSSNVMPRSNTVLPHCLYNQGQQAQRRARKLPYDSAPARTANDWPSLKARPRRNQAFASPLPVQVTVFTANETRRGARKTMGASCTASDVARFKSHQDEPPVAASRTEQLRSPSRLSYIPPPNPPSACTVQARAQPLAFQQARHNPSVNRSANGRPPAPGRWYAVHFHRPGAGVLPSSPGYLER
jgi:hypothetical protein